MGNLTTLVKKMCKLLWIIVQVSIKNSEIIHMPMFGLNLIKISNEVMGSTIYK